VRPAERLLIVLFGAIGDVTRALPLLQRLRRGWPDAHIAWAVEPLAAPVLADHPALDECFVFAREQGLRGFVALLRQLRQQRFDLVLDLGASLKSGLAALATGAPTRLGFHRRNGREGNWLFQTETIAPQPHYSSKLQQYLRFCDQLGLPESTIEFGLRASPAARQRSQEYLDRVAKPFAAFVLGSSCPSRRWFPEDTAAAAIGLWERYGHTPVLLGTAADRDFAREVVNCLGSVPAVDLTGRTTLQDLVALLGEATLAISPDSGAMHIAAALGIPVVSLWGATSAARSAPYGSVDAVVNGSAACAPCYLARCPIGRVCMRKIRAPDVLARAAAILRVPERVAT
jgi:heptosyltransferase-1